MRYANQSLISVGSSTLVPILVLMLVFNIPIYAEPNLIDAGKNENGVNTNESENPTVDEQTSLIELESSSYQDVEVKGTITDEFGEGLPGVSVIVKGTSTGTITNLEGNYSIDVPSDGTLVISYIGYKTKEVSVNGRSTIDYELEVDATELETVVVTGYGTQPKSEITGSISSVTSKDFEAQPVQYVRQALQGRTPGVQVSSTSGAPGNTGSIRIRGINSITTDSGPLVVIDGVLNGGLPSLNPADIESIEVLKDASATGLYGSRGANGVILVTTKIGKGAPKINFNSSVGFQYLPKKVDLLSAAEFAEVINDDLGTQGTAVFSEDVIDSLRTFGGTDWQDELYREGSEAVLLNHSLSVEGKSGKIGYYISGNSIANSGIVPNSFYNRGSIRSNLNAQVNDKLTVGLRMLYTDELAKNAFNGAGLLGTPSASALVFAPTTPVINPETGRFQKLSGFGLVRSPLAAAFGTNINIYTEAFNFVFNANYKIIDGLEYSFLFANTSAQTSRRTFVDSLATNGDPFGEVFVQDRDAYQHTHILQWSQEINEDHRLRLKGVFEETRIEDFGSTARSTVSNINELYFRLGAGTGATVNSFQGNEGIWSYLGRIEYSFRDRLNLTATLRRDGSTKFLRDNKWGTFPSAGLSYNLSEEAFLKNSNVISNLKLRASWGQSGNQSVGRFATFGGLNTSNNTFALAAIFPSFDGVARTNAVAPGGIRNVNLKWETTEQIDIGFDIGVFEERLNFGFDYFQKNTTDLLLAATLPEYFGPENINLNTGEIENKGIELYIEGTVIDAGDFTWDANFNLSTARTTVKSIGQDSIFVPGGSNFVGSGAVEQIITVGDRLGVIRGYKSLGVWGTDEVDEAAFFNRVPGDVKYFDALTVDSDGDGVLDSGDGITDSQDIVKIGNGAPDFIWGFNNTFRYKGFGLNVFLQSMVGQDVLNLSRAFRSGASANGSLTGGELRNAWTEENQNTSVPAISSSTQQFAEDTRFIEDGSFVRVKNVSLSYDLPAELINKIRLQKLSFSVSAQNLWTFTSYSGYDPEVNAAQGRAANTAIGFDTGVYPNPRVLTFGVNATF